MLQLIEIMPLRCDIFFSFTTAFIKIKEQCLDSATIYRFRSCKCWCTYIIHKLYRMLFTWLDHGKDDWYFENMYFWHTCLWIILRIFTQKKTQMFSYWRQISIFQRWLIIRQDHRCIIASSRDNGIINHIPSKVCHEITYPFPNFNGCNSKENEFFNIVQNNIYTYQIQKINTGI